MTGRASTSNLLAADRAEAERGARAERDVGEVHRAPAVVAAGQHPAQHVARAGAGATGGDDQVGPQRLVLEQAAQALGVVVTDPDPVRERARLDRGRGERVRVGVHHLTGLAGPAHVDEFVTGGHHDHPGAGPDDHVPDPGGREDRHHRRRHVRARRRQHPADG
jgi:hypothetical protein